MLSRTVYRAAALSAGIGSCLALSTSPPMVPAVPLASTIATDNLPTCVLVHGLDSSKETWNGVISDLARQGYPAIALDLRGHGESPLGDETHFSSQALACDVLHAIKAHVQGPVVLVGHSMGGKIAMHAAAIDAREAASGAPQLLSAVIVEDMDVRVRGPSASLKPPQQTEAALNAFKDFEGRRFESWDAARAALLPWYDDESRVDSWRGARVRAQPDGSWWSDVNPAAQRLARDRVLATDDAARAWSDLAAAPPSAAAPRMHVWYADQGARGTVCAIDGPGGLEEMQATFPAACFRFFPNAAHSIHNSQREALVAALTDVVRGAALRKAATATREQAGQSGPRTSKGG